MEEMSCSKNAVVISIDGGTDFLNDNRVRICGSDRLGRCRLLGNTYKKLTIVILES